MAKQVRETHAGSSISAWVILNKKGEHVATVNAHYSNSGTVTVDVWNRGDAVERCNAAVEKHFKATGKTSRFYHHDLQQGRAGGYGYDKFTAALAGLWIDGQQMANHCGSVANAQKTKDRLFAQYCKFHDYSGERARAAEKGWDRKHWDKRAAKIGARFANWCSEKQRFTSLHFEAGLERLKMLGYRVIQAI